MERLGAGLEQLDDRRVETDGDGSVDLEDEAGSGRWPTPSLTGSVAMPRTVHPQMRAQLEPTVEADQEVLALGLDRIHTLADDAVDLRDGAGTRGAGRPDVAPDQVRAQAGRSPE